MKDNYQIIQVIIDNAVLNEEVNRLMEIHYNSLHSLVLCDDDEDIFNTIFCLATYRYEEGDFCQWFIRRFRYLKKSMSANLMFNKNIENNAISEQVAAICESQGWRFTEERKKIHLQQNSMEKTPRGASTCPSIMRSLFARGKGDTGR